jgi:hypothetical protein
LTISRRINFGNAYYSVQKLLSHLLSKFIVNFGGETSRKRGPLRKVHGRLALIWILGIYVVRMEGGLNWLRFVSNGGI